MPSQFSLHKEAWINCKRCPLYKTRKNVVLVRGVLPAEVAIIGEGPGESEDVLALPFVGPAGRLLNQLLGIASKDSGTSFTMAWSNLVACIPKLENQNRKKVEPLPSEIAACWPRLDEFLDMCNPKLIIAVGELAKKQATAQHWEREAEVISIIHPAFLLRAGPERQGLETQRCIIQLTEAFEELKSA